MEEYSSLNSEINSIRSFALLNMLELDCADLNKEMSNRCLSLRNSLISWQVGLTVSLMNLKQNSSSVAQQLKPSLVGSWV
jgi:hypothetical protein